MAHGPHPAHSFVYDGRIQRKNTDASAFHPGYEYIDISMCVYSCPRGLSFAAAHQAGAATPRRRPVGRFAD